MQVLKKLGHIRARVEQQKLEAAGGGEAGSRPSKRPRTGGEDEQSGEEGGQPAKVLTPREHKKAKARAKVQRRKERSQALKQAAAGGEGQAGMAGQAPAKGQGRRAQRKLLRQQAAAAAALKEGDGTAAPVAELENGKREKKKRERAGTEPGAQEAVPGCSGEGPKGEGAGPSKAPRKWQHKKAAGAGEGAGAAPEPAMQGAEGAEGVAKSGKAGRGARQRAAAQRKKGLDPTAPPPATAQGQGSAPVPSGPPARRPAAGKAGRPQSGGTGLVVGSRERGEGGRQQRGDDRQPPGGSKRRSDDAVMDRIADEALASMHGGCGGDS